MAYTDDAFDDPSATPVMLEMSRLAQKAEAAIAEADAASDQMAALLALTKAQTELQLCMVRHLVDISGLMVMARIKSEGKDA